MSSNRNAGRHVKPASAKISIKKVFIKYSLEKASNKCTLCIEIYYIYSITRQLSNKQKLGLLMGLKRYVCGNLSQPNST
jgi:hypothetical protein